ncbi:LPS export ABC transporter periplasmic protein LptC [Cellulophaga fucicola]|uniref:LPS export ABC transporter protein LptC n=1 Tax=Cellulophaga fucicola TaxID=76595 RepID=A0A1K1QTU0_9FLAO|nr:LPS export ABC transporter periplasmic protein LptC [Cellulophaga fucicola]SFW63370.1 LPS export ABC transporter protein LptC [Cellulophaga fucicola]
MAMLFSCNDNYERVGVEAKKAVYPQGVANNLVFTYTETTDPVKNEKEVTSKVLAVLTAPVREDFNNLSFPREVFPKGLEVEFFDDKNQKSTITADYGISYSTTKLISLQGNVVINTHDGKQFKTPQLYYDQTNKWIFTQEKFEFINPEDESVMYGQGFDSDKDLKQVNAHKTTGLKIIKDEEI